MIGPAATVSTREKAIMAAVAPDITFGVGRSLSDISWPGSCQKARFQILAIAYRVSRLVATLDPVRIQPAVREYATPASISPTLPMKPENGGIPARFMAGTKNRIAISGASLANPPRRIRLVVPPRCSIRPAARNRVD